MFRVSNRMMAKVTITLNICNLKRNLTMFADGGKVFGRLISDINSPLSQWTQIGSNYQFRVNNSARFANSRVYKLTFELTIEPNSTVEVSLLPAYSYSEMLQEISFLEKCPHLNVSNLTYSLIGLAIPLLTFTRGDNPNKSVLLINCRVHPGEANASFMCRGLIKWLAGDTATVR